MNVPHDDEAWIRRATGLLDRSADALDAATLSRLNRARQAALAQRVVAPRRWILTAGIGAAAAAVFGLAIGLRHRVETPAHRATPTLQAADIDVLTSDDDALDLYENLDFYAWLETQPGGPNG